MTEEKQRFDVEIEDVETRIGKVTVEAADEHEAERIAAAMASTADEGIQWELDYQARQGLEVTWVKRSGTRTFLVETRDIEVRRRVFSVSATDEADARQQIEAGALADPSPITSERSSREIIRVEAEA